MKLIVDDCPLGHFEDQAIDGQMESIRGFQVVRIDAGECRLCGMKLRLRWQPISSRVARPIAQCEPSGQTEATLGWHLPQYSIAGSLPGPRISAS